MRHDHTTFNRHLSKIRVVSEHTIGLLKGRFPWMRCIRKDLTENPRTSAEIIQMVDACAILHNFLLKHKMEKYEEDWIDDDDNSIIDGYDRLPSGNDELNQPVPDGRAPDFRRTQLLYYLQETIGF